MPGRKLLKAHRGIERAVPPSQDLLLVEVPRQIFDEFFRGHVALMTVEYRLRSIGVGGFFGTGSPFHAARNATT